MVRFSRNPQFRTPSGPQPAAHAGKDAAAIIGFPECFTAAHQVHPEQKRAWVIKSSADSRRRPMAGDAYITNPDAQQGESTLRKGGAASCDRIAATQYSRHWG